MRSTRVSLPQTTNPCHLGNCLDTGAWEADVTDERRGFGRGAVVEESAAARGKGTQVSVTLCMA